MRGNKYKRMIFKKMPGKELKIYLDMTTLKNAKVNIRLDFISWLLLIIKIFFIYFKNRVILLYFAK